MSSRIGLVSTSSTSAGSRPVFGGRLLPVPRAHPPPATAVGAGQDVATIGDQTDPLEEEQRQCGEDDDRKEADRFHAALPPMPGRIASCCSAEASRLCGSTGAGAGRVSETFAGADSDSAWARAAAVMRAIFSMS